MPLYSVALRQAIESSGVGLYKWSNVVYVDSGNALAAASIGTVIWETYLRAAARQNVYCFEVYATDVSVPNAGPTPGTSDFATVPVLPGFQRGTYVADASGDLYWRDVCVNVELTVVSSRPDRKYWRPGLREGDFNGTGEFQNAALRTAIENAWSSLALDGNIKSSDNEAFISARLTKAGVRRLGRQARFDVPPPPPLG